MASPKVYDPLHRRVSEDGNLIRTPLEYSGTLDSYESFDLTSVIGKEFPQLQLSDILDNDAKLRDLAITVSQRGVVFFRNQDLQIEDQKKLASKLGELSGKPATSTLHRHAIGNEKRPGVVDGDGNVDNERMVISSDEQRRFHGNQPGAIALPRLASPGWHSDITFENVPSDYAILKMIQTPEDVGGDTLWVSAYGLYEKLSPPWRKFAEALTAKHRHPSIQQIASDTGVKIIDTGRGSPEDSGTDFTANHPVIRTNPVTGWKGLFAVGQQITHGGFNNVSEREDQILKAYFLQLVTDNHDIQVRFRWNQNDIAIWDNRSTFHTATFDYEGQRVGERIVSIGERPYLDPSSTSRSEALHVSQNQRLFRSKL